MYPFPLLQLTWRESVVGLLPTENVYMQIERNHVSGSIPGANGIGAGESLGQNVGSVKWRISEDILDNQSCWKLHSESTDAKTLNIRTEDVWVSMRKAGIVRQDESQIGDTGNMQCRVVYFADHIEDHRTGTDRKTTTLTLVPEGGMEALQRRFTPIDKNGKEFLAFDGLAGAFHKIRVEPAGRFSGSWGGDKYSGHSYRFTCEGKDQVAMLTDQGELVKVDFGRDTALMITAATRSRRRVPQPSHPSGA